jgi:hypothetical protein
MLRWAEARARARPPCWTVLRGQPVRRPTGGAEPRPAEGCRTSHRTSAAADSRSRSSNKRGSRRPVRARVERRPQLAGRRQAAGRTVVVRTQRAVPVAAERRPVGAERRLAGPAGRMAAPVRAAERTEVVRRRPEREPGPEPGPEVVRRQASPEPEPDVVASAVARQRPGQPAWEAAPQGAEPRWAEQADSEPVLAGATWPHSRDRTCSGLGFPCRSLGRRSREPHEISTRKSCWPTNR